jgi:outer membrane receptor protein involved in Fe transport
MNHFQPQGGTFQTVRGTFQFNGNMTRLQNGPTPADVRFNSWADFLLGVPSGAGKVDQLRNPNSLRMLTHALYVQDAWQVSRRLTVNLGLRWEIPVPTRGGPGCPVRPRRRERLQRRRRRRAVAPGPAPEGPAPAAPASRSV